MHTITVHDKATRSRRTHHTDDWVTAYALARKMHARHYGSRVTVTDPSGNTVVIRDNGWARA